MSRERAVKQRDRDAPKAAAKATMSVEPHLAHPSTGAARGDHKHFVEQVDASVARRIEALVDMLAWVRITSACSARWCRSRWRSP